MDRPRSESTLSNQDDRNCEHSSTNNKSRKAFDGYLRDEKSVNNEVNQKQGVNAVHFETAVASSQVSVWGSKSLGHRMPCRCVKRLSGRSQTPAMVASCARRPTRRFPTVHHLCRPCLPSFHIIGCYCGLRITDPGLQMT